MTNWIPTLHSEINDEYVSNPYPAFGEEVTVRFRVRRGADIRKAFLRRLTNGTNTQISMRVERETADFTYWACDFRVNQKNIHWHFILMTGDGALYFNREGTQKYPPTEDHDFTIIADFENPDWVPKSVFYQIFVDRFRNADSSNDVQDGSYVFEGHPTKKNPWGSVPPEYNEGFCVDFYGGDLEGVREKIPYLRNIGVNAVYLNPIFSAKTNHKYDCTDYFSVDPAFGGDRALKELVDELHANGMRVILDVSINHTGSEHVWYRKALADPSSPERSYYYFNAQGVANKWRGVDSLPQLNYSSNFLREVIYEGDDSLVRHYITQFGIDGWRFDVAMDTGRFDRDQFGNEIFARIRARTKELKKDCYLIGEHWKDNISYLLGDQLDGAMNYFATSRPLRCFAGEGERYLWTENIEPLNPKTPSLSGTGLADWISEHFTRMPNQTAFLQFNLIDSHDIHRLHNNRDIFDFGVYSGAVIFLYLLPGTPNVYYGDEIALAGDVKTVEQYRYPMEWDESKWNQDFLRLYTTLGRLKQTEAALQYGSWRILAADEDSCVLARWHGTKAFIGVIAKNPEPKELAVPVGVLGAPGGAVFTEVFSGSTATVDGDVLRLKLGRSGSALYSGPVAL